jgi:hypothetical protein
MSDIASWRSYSVRAVLWGAFAVALAANRCMGQTTSASAQSHGISISILKPEKSRYCALFKPRAAGKSIQITDTSLEFRQQVGRITESPVSFSLSEKAANLYCADIDLGRQYYHPAYFHVLVRYTDSLGKQSSPSFWP